MEQYLTTTQVAERLSVSACTIRRLVKTKGLPVHRVSSRSWRFLPDEVDAWTRTHAVTSATTDEYRDAIKTLVDSAPELSSEQAQRIASILGGPTR